MSAELIVTKKMALPGDVNRLTECQVRSYMEMDSTLLETDETKVVVIAGAEGRRWAGPHPAARKTGAVRAKRQPLAYL